MFLSKNTTSTLTACLMLSVFGLTACKSTPRTLRAANLSYAAPVACTPTISFTDPVKRTTDEKKMKKEMRFRTIELKSDMADSEVPCLEKTGADKRPYQVFEIPKGIDGRVVSAGSKLDTTVIFAGEVSTHDAKGQVVREFDQSEYRRLGTIYGVQFSPRANETYVLIKVNPDLIGQREATIETATATQKVYLPNASGSVSSGSNTVGIQKMYDRTYSYNGETAIRTVFPKPKK